MARIDSSFNQDSKSIEVRIPVRVSGTHPKIGKWSEITSTTTLSASSARFPLDLSAEKGEILRLALPMPEKLRAYDFLDTQYIVWAIVTDIFDSEGNEMQESYRVRFIGKTPPRSLQKNPNMRYAIQPSADGVDSSLVPNFAGSSASVAEDPESDEKERQDSRLSIPDNINLELQLPDGTKQNEKTVMENVSRGGASIFTTLNAKKGDVVQIRSMQYDVTLNAIVRGKRTGSDEIPRIHVEFLDGSFPLEGLD